MHPIHRILTCGAVALLAAGCAGPAGDTREEKRAAVREMRDSALQKLYAEAPSARNAVDSSVGYAVFSSIGTKIFVVASGRGYGVAVDRGTGKETFMKMIELGGGVGMGIQDLRQILVFNSKSAWQDFLTRGIDIGGGADVALKSGESGGAVAMSENVLSVTTGDVRIFQLTEAGAAVAATVTAAKYSVDEELN